MRHGVKMDLIPRNLGGEGAMYVDEEYMPFGWDEEKLYLKICKPTTGELRELEVSKRGNACSQFSVGLTSDRCEVYPLKSEGNNGTAL
eukprot:12037107-Ditylum_brightwellii.AAC.1